MQRQRRRSLYVDRYPRDHVLSLSLRHALLLLTKKRKKPKTGKL